MFNYESEAQLEQDREDLIHVLKMRFGDLAPGIIEKIYQVDGLDALERLILAAANAPKLSVFLEELEEPEDSFKLIGERFNPLGSIPAGGDTDGEKDK